MKKIILCLLAICFIPLSFAACDKNNNASSSSQESDTVSYNVNLFYSNSTTADKTYNYKENAEIDVDANENSEFIQNVRMHYQDEDYRFFAGWYDNPEFEGSRITQLKVTSDVNLYAKILTTYDALFDYFKHIKTKTYQNVEIHYNDITDNVYIDVMQNNNSLGLEYQITLDGAACSYKYLTTGSVWINATVGVPPVGTILQIGNIDVDFEFKYNGRRCSVYHKTDAIAHVTYNPYSLSKSSVEYLFETSMTNVSFSMPTIFEVKDSLSYYTI